MNDIVNCLVKGILVNRDFTSYDTYFSFELPQIMLQRKVLETYYIVWEKPTLNDQIEPDRLNLFENCVTWFYFYVNIPQMSF